jgi:sensor c-di-GMP phosphodiesterase-like protein
MKLWKWLVLIGSGIATALLLRKPKAYLDTMPELQETVKKAVKKAEEENKVALSKKTDEEITNDSNVNHQSTIERGKADIDSAASRSRDNLAKRLSSHSKPGDSDTI